jgi:acetyltransferase
VKTEIAATEDAALLAAANIGYPVVLKLYSKTITHKTDVGGVKLNLIDADDVARAFEEIKSSVSTKAGAQHFQGVTVQQMIELPDAYEIIVGSSIDPQFGPVLLFGSGGQLVEVYKDRALALPPLNATLARRMMETTRIFTALKGVRGRKPVDLAAMEQLLVRFSRLIVEQPWIKEIDINPLLASPVGLCALDARVVLHDSSVTEVTLPKLAIRPYPSRYVEKWSMKDGTPITIRPIRPEDEPTMVKFHQSLSEDSVRLRYFHPMKLGMRVAHERLTRVCFNDYDRELALVAERRDPQSREREILAVARMNKIPGSNEAEFALLVSDRWQSQGIGSKMLSMLIQVARDEKLSSLNADILPDNTGMQRICRRLGFGITQDMEERVVKATMKLA